jgi:hypothetical protein
MVVESLKLPPLCPGSITITLPDKAEAVVSVVLDVLTFAGLAPWAGSGIRNEDTWAPDPHAAQLTEMIVRTTTSLDVITA